MYILPIKEHSDTQTLAPVKLLSALLMFSIFKIVISHACSYIFVIIRNLIKILTTVNGIHIVMTQQRVLEKITLHIGFVIFFHGCYAWRHFISLNHFMALVSSYAP